MWSQSLTLFMAQIIAISRVKISSLPDGAEPPDGWLCAIKRPFGFTSAILRTTPSKEAEARLASLSV